MCIVEFHGQSLGSSHRKARDQGAPVFGEYDDMAADNDEGWADPAHSRHHPGVGHILVPAAEVVHRARDDVPLHAQSR